MFTSTKCAPSLRSITPQNLLKNFIKKYNNYLERSCLLIVTIILLICCDTVMSSLDNAGSVLYQVQYIRYNKLTPTVLCHSVLLTNCSLTGVIGRQTDNSHHGPTLESTSL